ncbi:MAG: hypothetical protein HYV75_01105 [Opitutae bacterium]|nr:hypothetical protein [Opitutae bacterium]
MKPRLSVLLATLVALSAGPLRAADPVEQALAKARAFLGSESALNSVTTIHFSGILEVDANTRLPVDIVFQKPFRQRITVTGPKVIEVTALDGYDAWQKRTNPANPTQWQVTLLDASQVKRLRANTWENLSFFAGIKKKGGSVQSGGDTMIDGVPCLKLSFIHAPDIVFIRYFDKATGRLVKTETEAGAEIREEGEMVVEGVRFPKKVVNKTPNGPSTTITFDRIELNTVVPAGEFAVPTLRAN